MLQNPYNSYWINIHYQQRISQTPYFIIFLVLPVVWKSQLYTLPYWINQTCIIIQYPFESFTIHDPSFIYQENHKEDTTVKIIMVLLLLLVITFIAILILLYLKYKVSSRATQTPQIVLGKFVEQREIEI